MYLAKISCMRRRPDQRPIEKLKYKQREPSDRDAQIVQAVYHHRKLSQEQLYRLFFNNPNTGKQVLRRLFARRFLARRFLSYDLLMREVFYVLDVNGAQLLNDRYNTIVVPSALTQHVTSPFLWHTVAINDFWIMVKLAAKQEGYKLTHWKAEQELKKGYDRVQLTSASGVHKSVSVIPDSYFVIDAPKGEAYFFLELDRARSSLKRFRQKVLAYIEYLDSGAYERRYKTKKLRILTVTTSKRKDHLKQLLETTQKAGGKRRFWFAMLHEITPKTVFHAPIWHVAGEPATRCLFDRE